MVPCQGWVLLLADWALSSGCNQFILGEWQYMLLRPYIPSIPAIMATSLINILGNDRSGCGRRLIGIHRTGYAIYMIFYSPVLLGSPFGEHSHRTQICLPYVLILLNLSTCLFPRPSCHQFSTLFFSSLWPVTKTVPGLWAGIDMPFLPSLLGTVQWPVTGKISPLLLSLERPERGYSAAAKHFLMVSAHYATICKKQVQYFLQLTYHRELHMRP